MYRIALPVRNSYRRRWSWKCLENHVPSFPADWDVDIIPLQAVMGVHVNHASRSGITSRGKGKITQVGVIVVRPCQDRSGTRLVSIRSPCTMPGGTFAYNTQRKQFGKVIESYRHGSKTVSSRPASNCSYYQNDYMKRNCKGQDLSLKADIYDGIHSADSYTSD